MKKNLLILIICVAMLLVAVAPIGATAEAPSDVPLPSLTADENCASYNASDDSIVYYYTGVKSSDYTSYIETLIAAEYNQIQTYSADGCNYALLDNGTNTIFVSFLRSVSSYYNYGRLRVFVQASGTPYHTQSTATAADVCAPKLWQLDVEPMNGDTGGMSYVIRLSDGTFVVIDGGYNTDSDAKNLYSILKANNPLKGDPVISAWFITHLHIDHYGILAKFSSLYADSVTVKGFYYNFYGFDIEDMYANNIPNIEKTMRSFKGAKLYSKLHSGMVMGFAGATIEVLATHEDVKQSVYEKGSGFLSGYSLVSNTFEAANDTSTVIRLNIEGQRIMFLADAQDGIGSALLNTYTTNYLKSDIMQMAHHGFSNGVSYKVIEAINPKVILWPMDIVRYVDGEFVAGYIGDTKSFVHYYNLSDTEYIKSAKKCASEIIPSYRNEMLSLPYTANTIYKSETVDIDKAIEAKMAVLSAAADKIYTQKSLDNTKIRFIGVVDIDEADFDKYSSFGFDISMTYNGRTYKNSFTTTTVYTSLIANGTVINASEYGGTYFYVVEVSDLHFANDDIEFVVNGTGTYKSGDEDITLSYSTVCYTVTPEFKTAENGNMTIIDFSDIISGAWKEFDAE